MTVSILHSDILTIREDNSETTHFGGDQEWYVDEWRRRAGCGPTCGANVTAYLALTRPAYRALYTGEDMRKSQFSAHMEQIYQYITPGSMGLNRVEMYTEGMASFAESRGLALQPHVFEAQGNMCKNRPSVDKLATFLSDGLAGDCPVSFLNLTKGRVKNLQSWHWITITGIESDANTLTAYASDEGKQIRFDMRLWYLTTRMRGGLIYFTEH